MQHKTLEQYLIECIQDNVDFCFNFKEIPNPEFLPRFKARYEAEFIKMEALRDI
jgi:hypothetical protein